MLCSTVKTCGEEGAKRMFMVLASVFLSNHYHDEALLSKKQLKICLLIGSNE